MESYTRDTQPLESTEERRSWLPAYVRFVLKWSPLLLCGYIASHTPDHILAVVAAVVACAYIFWAFWEG